MTDTESKEENHDIQYIARNVYFIKDFIVNLCLIGSDTNLGEWVLIDAGLSNSADRILEAAKEHFGSNHQLKAIVMTHGHFDHVGALEDLLLRDPDLMVYAHELELPYLTGESDYPSPDPTVGGGLMALASPLYPRDGIDLGKRIVALPQGGVVPYMKDWQWIHTPGHTPGHISLFREADGVMIAGDAFTTVKQESAWAVLTQEQEVHGPPAYFTTDWEAAWESVKKLEALHPTIVITGHGLPMKGEELAQQLDDLADDFDELAIPPEGRYVPDEIEFQ